MANKTIDVLQHVVEYWYNDPEIDFVMNKSGCDYEQIELMIKNGSESGELCTYTDGNEYRGWWRIRTYGIVSDELTKAHKTIDYLIDCTLATVDQMILRKHISKIEFQRQCSIAQRGINFLGPDYPYTSRAEYFAKYETAAQYYSRKRDRYLKE